MSVDLLARNLLVWWLHAGVLMATGLAAVHFLRWRHPASRLRFWQTLLAGALLLPIVEPWHVPIDASLAPLPPARAAGILTVTPAAIGQVDAPLRWQPWLLAVASAGIAGRALWLVAGLWRLRRWRRAGTPVTIDGLTGVDVREVDDLRGPASFGWAEPVILLPRTLTDPEVRAVAIAHEHQHVLRQDWLAGMLERTKRWPAAAPIATTTSNRCWLPRVSPMRRRCPSPNSSAAAAISWREWNNSSRSVPCPPSAWPAPPALPS